MLSNDKVDDHNEEDSDEDNYLLFDGSSPVMNIQVKTISGGIYIT